jgi:hypothetical protein
VQRRQQGPQQRLSKDFSYSKSFTSTERAARAAIDIGGHSRGVNNLPSVSGESG